MSLKMTSGCDRRQPFILYSILALAFVLRIVGIHYGLPYIYHQDEPIVVNHAMAIGVEGWNTRTYMPPQFASYFLFIVYGICFVVGQWLGFFKDKTDFALQFLKDPTLFYVLGRLFLGVLFGVATIAVLYRLGERFYSKKMAGWAAFFLAISMIHVAHSHYIYMDAALTFATTLLFFFLLAWMERPSWKNALVVGSLFGWAVSIKYTAVYFFPSIFLVYFFLPKKEISFQKKAALFFTTGVLSILVYAVVAPYTFLDWANFVSQVGGQTKARGYVGPWYHLRHSLLNGTGFLFLSIAFLGIFSGWVSDRKKNMFILFSVLIYYGVNIYFSQPFARYMMPLVPLFCLWASQGLETVERFLKRPWCVYLLRCALILELVIPTLYFDYLLLIQDTRTQCVRWMETNVPEKSVVVLDNAFFGPRLLQTREQVKEKYSHLNPSEATGARQKRLDLTLEALRSRKTYRVYFSRQPGQDEENAFLFQSPSILPETAELKKIGAQYLILNYSDPTKQLHSWKDNMSNELALQVNFSPYRNPAQKQMGDPHGLTGPPDSLADLFSRKSLGPYLEVYHVKETSSFPAVIKKGVH